MRVLDYTWAGLRTSDLKSTVRFSISLIPAHERIAASLLNLQYL